MNDIEFLKLKTIIRECIEEVFNERERMRLDEMARVGVMLNNLDVVVYTDDKGYIPHVHIMDRGTNGREFDCCVQLETNRYFSHGKHLDTFNNKQCREFNDFMKQPCRFPKYRNNYEFAVEMWNANNSDSYVQIRENELGEIIMPDYSTILPYK